MDRKQKTELLADLKKLFEGNDLVVVSHYKGLTVAEVETLRNDIRQAGAGFRITKNRITRLALEGTKFEGLKDLFTGPTAIAFSNDPIAAAKAVVTFSKTNEKLVVMGGGTSEAKVLSVDEVKYLASIPSLDELRAKLVGLLQAPASQVARVLVAYSEKDEAAA